ncbi:MAG: bifunctional folylpolyglutamate synthase/dihydrofolate synthase, partial [Candidatus Thioglobus sp.]
QRQNAALAIAAIKLLPDFVITQKQISAGIKNAQLAGRFQSKNINGKTLILDVAHNPAAIEALANTLQKNPQPTLAIFSALKDKDIAQMIGNIAPLIDEWLLLPIESQRAISMPDLSKKFGLSAKIKICENMPVALHQALHNSQVQRIVIFGSFYVVADALKVVKSNLIKP